MHIYHYKFKGVYLSLFRIGIFLLAICFEHEWLILDGI